MSVVWKGLGTARRVHDWTWDRRLGIETLVVDDHDGTRSEWADNYAPVPTPYAVIHRILSLIDLQHDDVLVDVGCGSGRVVCCAARYPIRAALGVELLPESARRAQRNLQTLRGRNAQAVGVEHADAQQFDYTSATVLFLFNPFGEATMRKFLELISDARLHSGVSGDARPVRIAYYNPVFRDLLLEESPWVASTQELVVLKHRIEIFTS